MTGSKDGVVTGKTLDEWFLMRWVVSEGWQWRHLYAPVALPGRRSWLPSSRGWLRLRHRPDRAPAFAVPKRTCGAQVRRDAPRVKDLGNSGLHGTSGGQ